MTTPLPDQRNPEATIWCGDLDPQVDESLLWELMLQAGPVVSVHIPRDKLSQLHSGYGFVEFKTEEDAEYAINIMRMVRLFNRPLKVNKFQSSKDKREDPRAVLFIGGLASEVDEKMLSDTFSAFGTLATTPKIMYDPETGASKGFGFVSYESFQASDLAISQMDNQHFAGKIIKVSYAFKKDGKKGERHGSQEEREYVDRKVVTTIHPNRIFSNSAGSVVDAVGGVGGQAPVQPPVPVPAPMPPQNMYAGYPPMPNPYGNAQHAMPPPMNPGNMGGYGYPPMHAGQPHMGMPNPYGGAMPPMPPMPGMMHPPGMMPPGQGFIPPPPQPHIPRPPPPSQ